jgi:hypothetical protein
MRQVTRGTPHPTDRYVMPRSARTLVLPSSLLGCVLAGLMLFGHFAGYRAPLLPGPLASAHAPVESACENCHRSRGGVARERCQRCHDAGAAPRMTHAAHVLFGSGDPRRAAAQPGPECAACHVDHAGRSARLGVDEVQCVGCHFRGFGAHPELAVRRTPVREVPGLRFSHQRHVDELGKQGATGVEACVRCHEPEGRARDLEPISFERHCASCHAKGGSLGVIEPVSAAHALPPARIAALGVRGEWLQDEADFEESRGRVQKNAVSHADPWVLWNLARVQGATDPEAWSARRATRQARVAETRRRLALQAPPAGLDVAGLTARREQLVRERDGLDARLAAQAGGIAPAAGLDRLAEVATAAEAAGDAALAAELRAARGASLASAAAAGPEAHAARVAEILALLAATEAAHPAAAARAEDLRRRARALVPGASGADTLARARAQREDELRRIDDELTLRAAGLPPTPIALLAADRRQAADRLRAEEAGLAFDGESPGLADVEREALLDTQVVLAAPCLKCHVLEAGALAEVRAARPVLTRSVFVHRPHLLQADCQRCHPGIEKSQSSADLHVAPLATCQECHRGGRVSADCATCHRYHPEAAP